MKTLNTSVKKTLRYCPYALIYLLFAAIWSCQKADDNDPAILIKQTWSSESGSFTLASQPDLTMIPIEKDNALPTIHVDPSIQYQQYLGFGESFEGSTIYNLSRMTPMKRTEILEKLIDPVEGAGFNLFRICIGTSDFTPQSWGWYSLDDMPDGQTDPDLLHFSIQKDIDNNIISVLKEALQIAEDKDIDLRFIASPWSPPAWMKSNKPYSMAGGQLLPQYNNTYARYLHKFLDAYKNMGIPIYAITVQNEPGCLASTPSTGMLANQEAAIIKLLKTHIDGDQNIDTKILAFDWNFNNITHPLEVLSDQDAMNAVYGVALHAYDWQLHDENKIKQLHDLYPNLPLFHTERAMWNTDGMDLIVKMFRNWISTYVGWVTLLDSDNVDDSGREDEQYPGAATPPYFELVASDSDVNIEDYRIYPTYYLKQQFSKYIQPGAKRIYSDAGTHQFSNVAFLNPDETVTLVVVNQNESSQQFRIVTESKQTVAEIPGKTVATYQWNRGSDLPSPAINLAKGKKVVASTIEFNSVDKIAYNAVDGDWRTRWASEWADSEWIYVDLGAAMPINRVVLDWEDAFGKEYLIQLSNDAQSWETVYYEKQGYYGEHACYINSIARYVKMTGISRGTSWGYSLFEFKIF